ncbi:TPA: hypothetical protein CPT98_09745 [Candidatus Gastranaerophilales bacterium HUM_19]|nr:MAG TPA: hypothetical protein CPT98_09745 [Candidatus Gastranaerophilales bacterium HUM_19]
MFFYDDKEFLGKKIKQLRVNSKLSQAELSEKIGMTEKNLSNIERGLQVPALNSFLRLLDVLNVSLTEFGISTSDTKNENRDELIKEIYLASPNEIEAYLKIIKTIKNIKGYLCTSPPQNFSSFARECSHLNLSRRGFST